MIVFSAPLHKLRDVGGNRLIGNFVNKIDGTLFENGVFSILRKHLPAENIKFWRTTSKQEIDFVIDTLPVISAYEVKLRYTGQPLRNLLYFREKYRIDSVGIITLEKITPSKEEEIPLFYPWELFVKKDNPRICKIWT